MLHIILGACLAHAATASIGQGMEQYKNLTFSDAMASIAESKYFVGAPSTIAPQQVHIGPGPSPGTSMRVTWITYELVNVSSTVTWWPSAVGPVQPPSAHAVVAQPYTYSAGMFGWHGYIYTAVMTGLNAGSGYYYSVGAPSVSVSDARLFFLPPAPSSQASLRLAVTADQGTIVPLGWAVADRLAQDHLESQRYDAVLISGDLSYATVEPSSCSSTNPGCDEVEWTWDAYGLQIEPYAATAPFIAVVGNHEHVAGNISFLNGTIQNEFASFSARYPMPSDAPTGGLGSYWYSVEMGPVHMVAMSTEHDFAAGSPQWMWLDSNLGAVDRSTTPWIIVSMHRPVLSAAVLEWEDHQPGAKLSLALEPLFHKHAVDLVIAGHIHSYETTFPVLNGTVTDHPVNGTYKNPTAPLYVVQGTSGALPENVFFSPAPAWSNVRILGSFGYGRLTVTGAQSLAYEYVGVYGEILDSWSIIKTASEEGVPAAKVNIPLHQLTVNILQYGGVGNGRTDNTAAFEKATAAIGAAGGGILVVPAGTWLTTSWNMTSNMTLSLEDGCTLLGGTTYETWAQVPAIPSFNDGPRYAPLLGGVGLINVRIVGNYTTTRPTVDGQGLVWEAAHKTLNAQRPHLIEFNNCTNVEVAGLQLLQSAFWTVHPVFCTNVHAHDLTITSTVPNGDGFDPDGSENVLLENVVITTGDDSIAIKSGTAAPGSGWPATRNVTIRNSQLTSSEACVAIGSEMTAGVTDVTVGPNVTCSVSGHGALYIKQRQFSGGFVSNIRVQDMVLTGPFIGKVLWLSQHFGEHGENLVADGAEVYPVMTNISLSGITKETGTIVLQVAILEGDLLSPLPDGSGFITNLSLSNINVGAPLAGWTCANVSGTWSSVTPQPCAQIQPQ